MPDFTMQEPLSLSDNLLVRLFVNNKFGDQDSEIIKKDNTLSIESKPSLIVIQFKNETDSFELTLTKSSDSGL